MKGYHSTSNTGGSEERGRSRRQWGRGEVELKMQSGESRVEEWIVKLKIGGKRKKESLSSLPVEAHPAVAGGGSVAILGDNGGRGYGDAIRGWADHQSGKIQNRS